MIPSRVWLRSAPGQLALLAAVLLGGAVLAGLIVALRGPVFERHARETYPPPDDFAREAARTLADPDADPASIEEIGRGFTEREQGAAANGKQAAPRFADLEAVYGAWIGDAALDRGGHLPRRLTELRPDWVFGRLRVTLVAGSPAQQSRALAWLERLAGDERYRPQIEPLVEYARRKAQRRGDENLRQEADAVLAPGRPRVGVP